MIKCSLEDKNLLEFIQNNNEFFEEDFIKKINLKFDKKPF